LWRCIDNIKILPDGEVLILEIGFLVAASIFLGDKLQAKTYKEKEK